MNSSTLQDFFKKAFSIKIENMKVNEQIDVHSFGIGVLSHSHVFDRDELKRVNKIVRKEDSLSYQIYLDNDSILKCSKDHRLFVKFYREKEPTYLTVDSIFRSKIKCFLYHKDLGWIKYRKIEKTSEKIQIYDFEVEKNNNYYSDGVLSHNTTFGDSKTTTGGNALKFYATQRIRLYTAGKKNDTGDVPQVISVGVRAKIIKNKIAPPFRDAIFDIRFGEGIDKIQNLIKLAVEQEIIKKSGSWYSYGQVRLGQGEEAVRTLLLDNVELTEELDHRVRVNCGLIQE